ncbi:hypothetical protein OIU79_014889 [Salix purpurea]|uniref:Uncharacterized protein n=1 Tax=Salix purpurea TaxID=77065 RepID=A0A9Q0PAG6_SALPP|nr:hypothetical protein OIU79_014889 [Salix purpurea]
MKPFFSSGSRGVLLGLTGATAGGAGGASSVFLYADILSLVWSIKPLLSPGSRGVSVLRTAYPECADSAGGGGTSSVFLGVGILSLALSIKPFFSSGSRGASVS